jgi:hypothetical protein
VTVANADAGGTRNGIVVYLERGKGSDGKQQLTYAVQFEEGDYITIESGVEAKRIKYIRKEDCGVDGKGESNPITDEEEKGGEDRSHASYESSAKVDLNDGRASLASESSSQLFAIDRRASLEADRWEPPPVLQRKREQEFESSVNQRPNKAVKREEVKIEANNGRVEINNENECVLTIPSWWTGQWGRENRKRLFSKSPMTKASSYSNPSYFTNILTVHLIGAPTTGGVFQGHKQKHLVSETGCWMHVSGHNADDIPMRITIKPKKNRKRTRRGKERTQNDKSTNFEKIRLAISMIEKSLVEFLADKNSENRLLYELAATAKGTLCHNPSQSVPTKRIFWFDSQ